MNKKLVIILIILAVVLASNGQQKEQEPRTARLSGNVVSAFNSPILSENMGGGWFRFEIPQERRRTIEATITAYNLIPEQTDDTPCISASGHNICGKRHVVACPRSVELGTWIIIDGVWYQCLDRLAVKYDNRFDVSFDKDVKGALAFGRQIKKVVIVDN